jgi:CRP/FNR family transcriptional regulator
VTGAERQHLAERGIVRRLPAGTRYLREGDGCAGIALVLSGRLRVAKTSPGGRSITLYHIEPGETCILTASCLLAGSRYPAEAVVVEEVAALLLPGDLFRQYFDTVASVRAFVLDHFTDRLAAVMALVEEVAFRRVDQRVARWLADEDAAGRVVTLSHEGIADHLGTARVVVSRILEDFEARGWLRLGRRRVDVLEPAALRAFGNRSD